MPRRIQPVGSTALAEREGFEPSIGFHLYTLSRGALSAAQPPLRARNHNVSSATRTPKCAKFIGNSAVRRCSARARRAEHRPAIGGEGGIRTLEGRESLPVFKTGAFNRSATSPRRESRAVRPYLGLGARSNPDRRETQRAVRSQTRCLPGRGRLGLFDRLRLCGRLGL